MENRLYSWYSTFNNIQSKWHNLQQLKQRSWQVALECLWDFIGKRNRRAICLSWPINRRRKLIILQSHPPPKRSKRVLTDELSSFPPQLYNEGIILFENYHDPFLWRNFFFQSGKEKEWIMRRKHRRICTLHRRTHGVYEHMMFHISI